jgi:hypothetical protein
LADCNSRRRGASSTKAVPEQGGVRQRTDAMATKTHSRIPQITARRLLSKLGNDYIR